MVIGDIDRRRLGIGARGIGHRTPRVKRTAGRRIGWIGGAARYLGQSPPPALLA